METLAFGVSFSNTLLNELGGMRGIAVYCLVADGLHVEVMDK